MSPSQQDLPITLFKISLGILYPICFFSYGIYYLTCHIIWLFYLLSVFTANLQALLVSNYSLLYLQHLKTECMWQALGKYLLGGEWMNEWMNDEMQVTQLSAPACFSFQLFSLSSFSAGGWALPPGSHCQAGKRDLAAPNQCADSHVIIYFLSVPCWVILSDMQEKKELWPKKHQEVGRRGWQRKTRVSSQKTHSQGSISVSFENQVIQSPTPVSL